MMGSYGNGIGSLGWLGMGVFWLLLLALIVWLVMRLLPGSGRTSHTTGDSAAEILDRRLASGEIDVPAWQAQRAALQGTQDSRK
jgi:putative membrane protein